MIAVPFTSEHLNQLNQWVTKWKGKILPPSFYPEIGGFIVENHCAAFLYLTNTSMAFYENIIVNPDSNETERTEAINLVDSTIADFAKLNNVILMMGRSANASIIKRGIDNGWSISKDKYNLMYKNVGDLI